MASKKLTPLDKVAKSTRTRSAAPKAQKPAQSKKAALPSSEEGEQEYQYPEGWKPPKSLAAAADKLYLVKAERLAMSKQADEKEVEEKALKHWLIDNLPKSDAGGIAGKVARVSIVKKEVPKISDYPEFYAGLVDSYMKHKKKKDGMEDGAFALLQRKVGAKAVQEMWAAGLTVPGVGKFTVIDLSLSKL